ncbi:hypothetical protein RZS08_21800, partial [Arthrospira platensis SPKY1]|nr:hypothetical protein [Arthrospira platensis SPKY1]
RLGRGGRPVAPQAGGGVPDQRVFVVAGVFGRGQTKAGQRCLLGGFRRHQRVQQVRLARPDTGRQGPDPGAMLSGAQRPRHVQQMVAGAPPARVARQLAPQQDDQAALGQDQTSAGQQGQDTASSEHLMGAATQVEPEHGLDKVDAGIGRVGPGHHHGRILARLMP